MTEPVQEFDVAALGPLEKLAGGGQGSVYRLRDTPDGPVYKEYLPRVVDDLDVDALRAFVRFAGELGEDDRKALLSRVAWPQAVVRRDGVVRGFLMNQVPPWYRTELQFVGTVSQELATAQFLLNPPRYLKKVGLRVTDRFRVEFLADTASTLALLHRLDITVGDLSPNNLLFSLTEAPRCFFVDSDSMRLGEFSVLPQGETPDWRVGDLGEEELATRASDVYKFGLLAARLFAGDQHTTDPVAAPVRLRRHLDRCLATDPEDRPPAGDLVAPLNRVLSRLPTTPPPEEEPEEQEQAPEEVPTQRQPPPPPRPPVPRPTPARSPRAWFPFLVGVTALLGIVFASIDGDDSGSNALPTVPFIPGPTDWDTGFPDYTLPSYPYGSIPNLVPTDIPVLPGLSCLTAVDEQVRGGDGLTAARDAVGELCASAVFTQWQQLSETGPYHGVEIVGFFGEGTATPTATIDLTGTANQCWRASVEFDAAYEVRSVGPLSPCG